jgi:hypothetical protein
MLFFSMLHDLVIFNAYMRDLSLKHRAWLCLPLPLQVLQGQLCLQLPRSLQRVLEWILLP